ncbi:MAG TPA: HAD-IIB family hydrolase [Candidatus Nanoarchaeia archaeon]|nr:HAD-IIB family hydrolase [Candidatus Nanoarchaeia archaeon]
MGIVTLGALKNIHRKKIIVADVDGTICESCTEISQEMAQQIDCMVKAGYQFAFISGTPIPELKRMISGRLTEQHHLLGNNGTNYVACSGGVFNQIYNYPFNSEEKREIIAAFEKLITAEHLTSLTTKEDQLQDRGSQITLSILGRTAPKQLKAQYDPEGQIRAKFITFLQKHLNPEKYDMKIGGTTSIDATRKGQDKAFGLKSFLAYHHKPLSEVIFLGDKIYPHGNDYEASKIVDSIAVKNLADTLGQLKKILNKDDLHQ